LGFGLWANRSVRLLVISRLVIRRGGTRAGPSVSPFIYEGRGLYFRSETAGGTRAERLGFSVSSVTGAFGGNSGRVTGLGLLEIDAPISRELFVREIVRHETNFVGSSAGRLSGEFCDRQIQANTQFLVFRLYTTALNGGTGALR
jgi:hypothetical protein